MERSNFVSFSNSNTRKASPGTWTLARFN